MPFVFYGGSIILIPIDVKYKIRLLVRSLHELKAYSIEAIKRIVDAQYAREGKDSGEYCRAINIEIELLKKEWISDMDYLNFLLNRGKNITNANIGDIRRKMTEIQEAATVLQDEYNTDNQDQDITTLTDGAAKVASFIDEIYRDNTTPIKVISTGTISGAAIGAIALCALAYVYGLPILTTQLAATALSSTASGIIVSAVMGLSGLAGAYLGVKAVDVFGGCTQEVMDQEAVVRQQC